MRTDSFKTVMLSIADRFVVNTTYQTMEKFVIHIVNSTEINIFL